MKAQKHDDGRFEIESPTDRTRILFDPATEDFEAVAPDVDDLPETPPDDPSEPKTTTVPPTVPDDVKPVYTPKEEDSSWLTWKD